MGQGAAGIGDQSGDLGEGDDPGGVGHLADQDLTLLDGVQLGGIGHQVGDALLHAGAAGDALEDRLADLSLLGGLLHLGLELLGIAPQRLVGLLIDGPLGGGAVPLLRMTLAGFLHLGAAGLDQLLDGIVRAAGAADLVILQHEDILGVVQNTLADHSLANLDESDAHVRVDALVDIEVVIGGDGSHLHAQLQIVLELCQLFGVADHGIELLDSLLLGLHAGIVLGVVIVVVVDIGADGLVSGGGVFVPGLVDELVSVHSLEAVLVAVSLHHLQELLTAGDIGDLGHDLGVVGSGEEQLLQSGNTADLFLHLPQGLQRVPVAVGGGDVDLADEDIVSSGSLGGVGEVGGGLELSQVDDPVDPEGLGLHVQHILHVDHDFRQGLVLKVEVQDRGLDLLQTGNILLLPAVHEGVRVDGHDLGVVVEHRADLVGIHLGGDHGGVDIAADLLGDPGLADRGAEPLIHVGAVSTPAAVAVPPAADVEVQGGDGVGAVQIVVEPHQALLGFVLPLDGEAVVGEFCRQDLGSIAHDDLSFFVCS